LNFKLFLNNLIVVQALVILKLRFYLKHLLNGMYLMSFVL